MSLVLFGESRLGKTVWARSLGNHVYFGGLFSLDEFRDDMQYAVFDDMQGGLKFFPSYKFWLGHQMSFICTDKYRAKRRINWGKPAIYICNNDPRDEGADNYWLEANCIFVEINEPIVHASTPRNQ
jgi:hypothetical protein